MGKPLSHYSGVCTAASTLTGAYACSQSANLMYSECFTVWGDLSCITATERRTWGGMLASAGTEEDLVQVLERNEGQQLLPR